MCFNDPDYAKYTVHPKNIGPAPKFPAVYTSEEIEYLSDPIKMFGALGQRLRRMMNGDIQSTSDNVVKILYESVSRKDKSVPPACIFCLNKHNDLEVSSRLGCLIWFPRYPDFFAGHEVCMSMCPKVNVVDGADPYSVTYLMCSLTLKSISAEIRRANNMKCTHCKDRLAIIGCVNGKCRKVFHLSCAIKINARVDFHKFSIYCPLHTKNDDYIAWLIDQFYKIDVDFHKKTVKGRNIKKISGVGDQAEDTCIICQETLEIEDMRPIYEKTIVTNCCREMYTHFECMKRYINSRGLEVKCPHCSNEETKELFCSQLALQGLIGVNVDPDDDGPDNEDIPCIAQKNCMCPDGPGHYDVDEGTFKPFISINKCIGCARMSHRACAGFPWDSLKEYESERDEPQWVCVDCSESGVTQFVSEVAALADVVSPEDLEVLKLTLKYIQEDLEKYPIDMTGGKLNWNTTGTQSYDINGNKPHYTMVVRRDLLKKIDKYNKRQAMLSEAGLLYAGSGPFVIEDENEDAYDNTVQSSTILDQNNCFRRRRLNLNHEEEVNFGLSTRESVAVRKTSLGFSRENHHTLTRNDVNVNSTVEANTENTHPTLLKNSKRRILSIRTEGFLFDEREMTKANANPLKKRFVEIYRRRSCLGKKEINSKSAMTVTVKKPARRSDKIVIEDGLTE